MKHVILGLCLVLSIGCVREGTPRVDINQTVDINGRPIVCPGGVCPRQPRPGTTVIVNPTFIHETNQRPYCPPERPYCPPQHREDNCPKPAPSHQPCPDPKPHHDEHHEPEHHDHDGGDHHEHHK
jgi:hypothetical protein